MNTKNPSQFLRAIAAALDATKAQGRTPVIHIEQRRTGGGQRVGDAINHAISDGVHSPQALGPAAKWALSSVMLASAGCSIYLTQDLSRAAFDMISKQAHQAYMNPAVPAAAPLETPAGLGTREVSGAIRTAVAQLPLGEAGVRMVPVRFQGKRLASVYPADRVALAKEAAQSTRLNKKLGADAWKVVYGVISAESNWVPRNGMGANKRVSYGIAQMESPTAKALGIDPMNAHESAVGVAKLIDEASNAYRSRKHQGLVVTDELGRQMPERTAIAAYISVHYNTSSSMRANWGGNVGDLEKPTQVHIKNVSFGISEASAIERQMRLNAPTLKQFIRNIETDALPGVSATAPAAHEKAVRGQSHHHGGHGDGVAILEEDDSESPAQRMA